MYQHNGGIVVFALKKIYITLVIKKFLKGKMEIKKQGGEVLNLNKLEKKIDEMATDGLDLLIQQITANILKMEGIEKFNSTLLAESILHIVSVRARSMSGLDGDRTLINSLSTHISDNTQSS